MAQRVGSGIVILFHDSGNKRGWVVSRTARPHFTPGKDPVSILQEARWAPGPVWTGVKPRPHRDFFLLISTTYNRLISVVHSLFDHKCPFYTVWVSQVKVIYTPPFLCPPCRSGIRSRTVQPVVSHYTDWATRSTVFKSTCSLKEITPNFTHIYTEFMCSVWLSQQKAVISLYTVNTTRSGIVCCDVATELVKFSCQMFASWKPVVYLMFNIKKLCLTWVLINP